MVFCCDAWKIGARLAQEWTNIPRGSRGQTLRTRYAGAFGIREHLDVMSSRYSRAMILETWEESEKALDAASDLMARSLIQQAQAMRGQSESKADTTELHKKLKASLRRQFAKAG